MNKQAATPEIISTGHIVEIKGKRFTVLGTKLGNKYWTVRLHQEGTKGDFTWKIQRVTYRDNSNVKFIGVDKDTGTKLHESYEHNSERAEKVQDIVDANNEQLKKLDVDRGDIVLFKYTNGTKEEAVADINYKTGKIAISRLRGAENDFEYLSWYLKRSVREFRWLNAQNIISVVTKFKDTYKCEKVYPFGGIPEKQMREMQSIGWSQVNYSNGEFITKSAVIGLTPAMARKGQNLDGASKTIYWDKQAGFFWRETGSFD